MGSARSVRTTAIEAKVTSKSQVTLPKLIRERLGIQTGSRIRFVVDSDGRVRGELVLLELKDPWAAADRVRRAKRPLSVQQML